MPEKRNFLLLAMGIGAAGIIIGIITIMNFASDLLGPNT